MGGAAGHRLVLPLAGGRPVARLLWQRADGDNAHRALARGPGRGAGPGRAVADGCGRTTPPPSRTASSRTPSSPRPPGAAGSWSTTARGPTPIGWSYSEDGVRWEPGRRLVVQPAAGRWAKDVRTAMGLVYEGRDRFTLFYTGFEQDAGLGAAPRRPGRGDLRGGTRRAALRPVLTAASLENRWEMPLAAPSLRRDTPSRRAGSTPGREVAPCHRLAWSLHSLSYWRGAPPERPPPRRRRPRAPARDPVAGGPAHPRERRGRRCLLARRRAAGHGRRRHRGPGDDPGVVGSRASPRSRPGSPTPSRPTPSRSPPGATFSSPAGTTRTGGRSGSGRSPGAPRSGAGRGWSPSRSR